MRNLFDSGILSDTSFLIDPSGYPLVITINNKNYKVLVRNQLLLFANDTATSIGHKGIAWYGPVQTGDLKGLHLLSGSMFSLKVVEGRDDEWKTCFEIRFVVCTGNSVVVYRSV